MYFIRPARRYVVVLPTTYVLVWCSRGSSIVHPISIENMKYWGKRDSQYNTESSSESSTNKSDYQDVEWRETERTTHNKWDHDVPFELLKEDVETDNTENSPHTYFWTHEHHEKRWNKSNNRSKIWNKFHSTGNKSQRKNMIHWEPHKLSYEEPDKIHWKHECRKNQLSTEPCMNRSRYSTLTATEIVPQLWREYSQKPMNKGTTFKNNEKCKE